MPVIRRVVCVEDESLQELESRIEAAIGAFAGYKLIGFAQYVNPFSRFVRPAPKHIATLIFEVET